MKVFRLLLGTSILLSIYSCGKKENANGSIKGKLSNASETMVYIQSISEEGEKILDSAKTDSDGNFEMSNPVKEIDYYMFRTDPGNAIFLILKGGENLELSGDGGKLDATYDITGSDDSKLLRQLRHFEKILGDSLNKIYAASRIESPANAEQMGSTLQTFYTLRMQEFSENFVGKNQKSLAALSATKYLDQNKNLGLMESLEKNLQQEFPGNKYVADYGNLLAELHKLPAGSMAPEILLPTPEGKTESLSSLRGKVVLVDFWASWCGPCRKENPFVVSLYQKYKAQGFDIFGVSLDDNAEAWKTAIQKDGLVWHQVSELKKWNSQVAKTYGVDAIPFSVLLDKEGKIIGKGLRGPELENKIRIALGINS